MKLVEKIAKGMVKFRLLILVLLILITVVFGIFLPKVKLGTTLRDLLPQNNSYVKLHNEFSDIFGGTNMCFIMVSVKKGDIFNPQTLTKVRKLSEALFFVPGADRYKIISITQRKIKNVEISDWGVKPVPLIEEIPTTEEQFETLKEAIYTNPMYAGPLVSMDGKHTLVIGEFREAGVDYTEIFEIIKKACKAEEDANTEVRLAGEAMIRGYVYSYLPETKIVFVLTMLAMAGLLFAYTRSLQMTLLPMLSALVSAVWGLGFIGMIGFELDPLILVVPVCLLARTLSHSVQFNERFREEYVYAKGDVKAATENTLSGIFEAGVTGIIVDATGIGPIYFVPVPLLQKLALICIFMSVTIIFTVLFLNPVILYYGYKIFKPKVEEEVKDQASRPLTIFERVLQKCEYLAIGKRSWAVIGVSLVIMVLAFYGEKRITIGDANPGSPLLWPSSQYNKDAHAINSVFQGLDPMIVVLQSPVYFAMNEYDNMHSLEGFQVALERTEGCGGTRTIVDILKGMNQRMHEDYPKWAFLPHNARSIGELIYLFQSGSDPGDLTPYITRQNEACSLVAYFRDHQKPSIDIGIQSCKNFMKDMSSRFQKDAKFRYAAGIIGTCAAVNDEIVGTQVLLLVLAFGLTFLTCAIGFRSIVAGLILIAPLALSNYMLFSYMGLANIGLNINTLPVATLAIGIGVDYGIYLLDRLKQEFPKTNDLVSAYTVSVLTTGKAVTFTALTVALGVVFWSFSSIKFQAQMGILLTIVTFFHLLGTLILLPALVVVIKPKFITNQK